jgi:hypothetical protein
MQTVVEQLVEAVGSRNREGLRTIVGADAHMRALIPPGPVSSDGPDEISERYDSWFGWLADVELVSSSVEHLAGRWRFSYRLKVRNDDGQTMIVEQQGFCDVADGHITGLDLVCSGFRPVGAA